MKNVTCQTCGKEKTITKNRYWKKKKINGKKTFYCDYKCYLITHPLKPKLKKTCQTCGATFTGQAIKFCSRKCYYKAATHEKPTCPVCKKPIHRQGIGRKKPYCTPCYKKYLVHSRKLGLSPQEAINLNIAHMLDIFDTLTSVRIAVKNARGVPVQDRRKWR